MNPTAVSTGHWTVSTRPGGEVLVARCGDDEAELLLLGVPAGFATSEIEGWLRDVLAVARDTARTGGESPIPVVLHHILTGILFSHSELWSRGTGTAPCSLAFVKTDREAAFGWVGELEPRVWLAGLPAEIGWIIVRDEHGNEARAFTVDATVPVRIELDWSSLPGASGVPGIEVVAELTPAGTPRPAPAIEAVSAPPIVALPLGAPIAPAPPAFIPGPDLRFGSVSAMPTSHEPDAPPVFGALVEHGVPAPDEYIAPEIAPELAPEIAPELAHEIAHELAHEIAHEAPLVADAPVDPPSSPAGNEPGGNWTTVYEGVSSGAQRAQDPAPQQPAASRPGITSWLKGLLGGRRRAAHAEPAPSTAAAEFLAEVRAAEVAAARASAPHAVAPAVAHAAPPTQQAPPPAVPVAHIAPPVADIAPPVARVTPHIAHVEPSVPSHHFGVNPAAAMPELIPPTPEPEEVTARAIGWPITPDEAIAAAPENSIGPSTPPGEDLADAAPPAVTRSAAPPRMRRRPDWPAVEPRAPRPLWRRPGILVAALLALFAGGWLVGSVQEDRSASKRANPVSSTLRALGLGGARYQMTVNSRPPGAWIAIDGKDLALRTPATIDLAPGIHQLALSMSDLGSASFELRGQRGDRLSLDAPLWGRLDIAGDDMSMPVSASVDGRDVGFVPITLDSVLPGTHEVLFSGPGMASWGQTVQVRIGETAAVVARPMTSPATGVIAARATLTDENGTSPVSGAPIWVDGERKGVTPVTLELPRGPHSLRAEYQGERAAVQVIDLPGGNQRFATFEFGVGADRPQLNVVGEVARMSVERPAMISAVLTGVGPNDLREMWLHAKTPEGTWRRYQMVLLKATGGVVGVAVYPPAVVDENGRARWYVSASTASGDEYFTELQSTEVGAPRTR